MLGFFSPGRGEMLSRKGASTKTDNLNLIPRIYDRKKKLLTSEKCSLISPHYTHIHTYTDTWAHGHRHTQSKKERLIDETETQRDRHRNRGKRDRHTHREIKVIKIKANFIYLLK